MLKSDIVKRAGWLGGVGLLVAFMSCRDFEAAYDKCVTEGHCVAEGDGGTTDGGNTDGGNTDGGGTNTDGGGTDGGGNNTDGGKTDGGNPNDGGLTTDGGNVDDGGVPPDDLLPGQCSSSAGLCLRNKHVVPSAFTGFSGLWGSDAYNVFLAYGQPAVVRFNGSFSTDNLSSLGNAAPYRLHGSGPNNVWGINGGATTGTCSTLGTIFPDAGADCSLPPVRFDDQGWHTVPATNAGQIIHPPAIYTTAPDSTWVADEAGGALLWTGAGWSSEPDTNGDQGNIRAFWGDASGPRIGVGFATPSAGFPAFWVRDSGMNNWMGPTMISSDSSLFSAAFVAIAGPNEDNLYTVARNAVMRWQPGSSSWTKENLPTSLPVNCQLGDAQDVWVNASGSDVWVAFNSACVLHKHNNFWLAVRLPVPADFQALQVEGFDDTAQSEMNLWFTGYQPSGANQGAVAYRYAIIP